MKKTGLLTLEIGLYEYPNIRNSYPAIVFVGTGDG